MSVSKWFFSIALAINLGIMLSFFVLGIIAAQQDLLWRADFTAFYTGGAIVRDGLGKHLYDLELQTRYQEQILAEHGSLGGLLPFINPPYNALIYSWVAYFSLPIAFGIQVCLLMGFLGCLLWTLWKFTQTWSGQERVLFTTGVLAFYPLLSSILLGAFSLLILLCFLLWFQALKEKRQLAAGLWLLPACLKPQTAVLPGLMMLFSRRWKALATTAVGGLAMMLFTTLWLGPKIWLDFIEILRLSSVSFYEYGIHPSAMYNFKGTLALWLDVEEKQLINSLSLLGFLFSIGITWWLWRKGGESDHLSLRMSITLTLSVLFSLHVNPQDGLLLVAPAVIFYDYLRQENLPRKAYGVFLWLCLPLFLLSEFGIRESLGIRLPVLAMIVLLGWQLWAWRKTFSQRLA
jgi:hypothetical protein